MSSVPQWAGFRAVKVMDIIYVSLLYVLIAGSICWGINALLPEHFGSEHPAAQLAEIVGITMLIPVVVYFARNIITRVPSPFHGLYGLDSFAVHERRGSVILAFTLVLFMPKLVARSRRLQSVINTRPEVEGE